MRIYTLGTADRSEAEIAKILFKYQIHVLADIRRSTTAPLKHLRRENIQNICGNNRVEYLYLGNELGSERESGMADNLDQALYQRGLGILKSVARTRGLLILCHEKDPHRCNRRFIAAELAKDDAEVFHLLSIDELWTPPKHKPSTRPGNRSRPQGHRNREDRRRPPARGKSSGRPPLKKKTSRSKMDKAM